MKPLKLLLAGIVMLCLNFSSFAQALEIPELPQTKEEFPATEKFIIQAANWLETTQVGKEMDQRTRVNAYIVGWLTNSPSVSITIGKMSMDLGEKNPQFLVMFMAGYARYVLENNYSKDALKANLAGVKSVINLYNLGGDVKKNKFLQKAIAADKAGTLESWVKENLEKPNKN